MNEETTLDDFAQENNDSGTESNSIQTKISLSRLEEYISIIKGTKPDRVSDEQSDGSEPYLIVSTLTDKEQKYTPDTDGPKATPQDTLMIMDGSKSGRVYPGESGVIGSTMAAIRPENTNPQYLRYFLESNFERLNSATKGSAVPHTDKDLLRSLEYPVYPLPEQRKIATVLYTLDRAIEKVEKIITQRRKIKTGLLQSLYTDGYFEHTQFEQVRLVAKEFSFPASWELTRLDDIVESPVIDFGSFSSTKLVEYVEEGIPFLRSDMFSDEGLIEDQLKYIPKSVHKKLEKSYVYPGDILFTKIGVNLGKSTLYEGEYGVCNSNATVSKIRADTEKINKDYLTYYLQSFVCESQYRPKVVGTPPRINLGDVRSMKIPIPSEKEQILISEAIESVESSILTNRKEKNALERLKQGLLQDLFSGTVRTTDTNIQVPEEIAQYG